MSSTGFLRQSGTHHWCMPFSEDMESRMWFGSSAGSPVMITAGGACRENTVFRERCLHLFVYLLRIKNDFRPLSALRRVSGTLHGEKHAFRGPPRLGAHPRLAVISSVGTPLYPYGIAYRRVYESYTRRPCGPAHARLARQQQVFRHMPQLRRVPELI